MKSMSAETHAVVEDIWEWLSEIPDPEVPAISIVDLGIVRGVRREGGADDARRIDYALLLCVSRPARPAERETLLALLQSHRRRLAEGWLNPREVTTGDPAKLPALPDGATPQDAAAWTLVARVLLNLDETITRE